MVKEEEKIYAECQIANTGAMDGKEVIQVYLAQKERIKDKPVCQLKGFEKIFLKSGEKKKLRVEIEDYSENMGVWIGSSLRDIRVRI